MAKHSLDHVLQYLRRIALTGHVNASDAGLLDRFARLGDESAFEFLVSLHGPMVLGVCRRLLRHEQDAEDAFQATFLTLARKARTISAKESLASWLHRVACRAASRVRRGAPRANRTPLTLDLAVPEQEADVIWRDIRSVLDLEIAGLAERHRRPIVLCYLEGKTQEEAAQLLGWPKGTVASRLARAKDQLRCRLTRRGWAVSAGLLSTILAEKALAGALPGALARSTVRSVLAYLSGQAAEAGVLSAKVLVISEGVLRIMWLNKLKLVVGVVIGVVLAAKGVGVAVRQTLAEGGQDGVGQVQNGQPAQKERAGPKPIAQDEIKAEVAELRKEIAGMRKEMKSLQDALRQNAAAPEQGPQYQGKPPSFWVNQSKDADTKYRYEAVEALGVLARKNNQLIPVVVNIFKHDDNEGVRNLSASVLRNLGKESIPLFVDTLKDRSSNARLQAAWALGDMGAVALGEKGAEARAAAVPILTRTLSEDDWALRNHSINALNHRARSCSCPHY